MKNRILEHFTEARQCLDAFIADDKNLQTVAQAGSIMVSALQQGGKIMSCGNGGSHCDAMHFAEELTGRYRDNRKSIAAISISDVSHITCVGNDYGFDYIFSRFVEGMGRSGDVLLCISTSGNSANVLNAAAVAKEMGIAVIALTGKSGGKLAEIADVEIRAPFAEYADRAQEIHIKVIHALIDFIEQNL